MKRILVVEDEAITYADIEHKLKTLGYETKNVSSGEEAIKIIKDSKFDLIFMDIVLKGKMDGIETAQKIKESHDTPLVFLTAFADEEKLKRAKLAEPFGYILKPFEDRELHATIEMALFKHSAERKIKEERDYSENIIETIPSSIVVLDSKLRVLSANKAFYSTFQVTPKETLNHVIYDLGNRQWDIPNLKGLLEEVLPKKKTIENFEVRHKFEKIGERVLQLNARKILNGGNSQLILLAIEDITAKKKSGEHLSRTLSMLKSTLQSTADGILVIGPNGKVLSYNKKFLKLWNIPSKVAETNDDKKLLNYVFKQLKEPEKFIKRVDYLYAHPEKEDFEVIRFKDGRVFERCSMPAKLDNQPARVWSFRNITEKENLVASLKESELRYRRLFESAKDGILILDEKTGKIVDSNPYIRDLLGYSKKEINGKKIWQISPLRDIVANKKKFIELRKEGKVHYEDLPLQTKSGEIAYVEFVSNTYFVEDLKVIQCNIRDITDRKAKEEMETLEIVNKNLMEVNTAKTEFLNIVSHELKTPLTAMSAHLDILQESENNFNEQQRNNLAAIKRNNLYLKMMIENLLEMSRLESGKMELNLSKFNINHVIEELISNASILSRKKGIKLRFIPKEMPLIEADRFKVEEIVTNLLINAIKFTEKGAIEVSEKIKDGNIIISIKDTGMGIRPNDLKNLFQKFYQVDCSITRKAAGTGLGLSITKKLVEIHKGTISVKSEFGKGSTFSFSIPIRRPKGGENYEENTLCRRQPGYCRSCKDNPE